MEQIKEQVLEMIAQRLELDPKKISLESNIIKDLGADSLDIVQLVLEMETEFGLDDIPMDEVRNLQTVGDVVSYVQRLKR